MLLRRDENKISCFKEREVDDWPSIYIIDDRSWKESKKPEEISTREKGKIRNRNHLAILKEETNRFI